MLNRIKTVLCIILCISIFICLSGCASKYEIEKVYYNESVPGGVTEYVEVPDGEEEILVKTPIEYEDDEADIDDIDDTDDTSSDDTTFEKPVINKTYYVSSKGSDKNDGLSEKAPWKTISKVNSAEYFEGDKVLFCRGDEWRGETVQCAPGVSYGAYGDGANPILTGSNKNYSVKSLWLETATENVYKLNIKYKKSDDVGNIIFNDGEFCGIKVREGLDKLNEDLCFYHNVDGYVYLRCDNGNPASVYPIIDIVTRQKLMVAKAKNTVENITFRYANFGLTTSSNIPGEVNNVVVKNCKFMWIGGCSVQDDDTLRLGNAIEFWGCCYKMTVNNCEFTQIFDTAFTTQFTGNATVDTVTVKNNKIDRCFWGMEFWLQGNGNSVMKNITVEGNTFTNTAQGWSANQRWSSLIIHGAHISDLGYKNFKRSNIVIKNNNFGNSGAMLLKLSGTNWSPVIEGNTYKQYKDKAFGYIFNKNYTYNDSFINSQLKKIDKKAVASYQ